MTEKENEGVNWGRIAFWSGVASAIFSVISVGAALKADSEE